MFKLSATNRMDLRLRPSDAVLLTDDICILGCTCVAALANEITLLQLISELARAKLQTVAIEVHLKG